MGFFSRVIWTVFTPIIGVYTYVMQYFFGITGRPNMQQDDTAGTGESTNTPDQNIPQNVPYTQQSSGLAFQ